MNVKRLALILFSFLTVLGVSPVHAEKELSLTTPSGYQTDAWLYPAKGEEKATGIVYLHGKRGNPSSSHNSKFISKLSGFGYRVIAPLMPWSEKRGYQGTREQGLEVISAAVTALSRERVVVIGHSMGGIGVLHYGAQLEDDAVVGLVSVAPGHDPSMSRIFRELTGEKAAAACQRVASGNGGEMAAYPELNTGARYSIQASAEFYCSYYSVDEHPATAEVVFGIETPVLWMSAEDDRLTKVYAHKTNFDALGENSKHQYRLLPGKHKSVLFRHVDVIDGWIEGL